MVFPTILTLLLFLRVVDSAEDVKIVTGLIKRTERPTYVVATVCWTLEKKAKFLSSLKSEDANIALSFPNIDDITNEERINQHALFLVDASCPGITDFFQRNNKAGYFRSPFQWIIIDLTAEYNEMEKNKSKIPNALSNVSIYPDGDVTIVQEFNSRVFIYKVFRRNMESDWIIEDVGIWTQDQGSYENSIYNALSIQRLNLNGVNIQTAYVLTNNDTINHLNDYLDDHIDTITKVQYILTSHLFDFINATRSSVFVDTWGYNVNGTWSGMIGLMLKGEIELGGTAMFMTSDRIPVLDFIASPTPTKSKFVFRQPKLSYENNLFLLPFRQSVWLCSGALCMVLLGVLVSVARWEWSNQGLSQEKLKTSADVLRPNFSDSVLFMFGAACQQGSPVELKGSLGRVVIFILFLAFMFLYTSYAANIVALLQSSSSNIRTLEDMLTSRLKFGVDDVVFNRHYFSTASDPIRKAIYQKKIAPPGSVPKFMPMEEGIKNMKKGLFAFHMETGVGYKLIGKYFQEDEKCGLREIAYLQVLDPWMGVRKNTPYKEMFKIGMYRIQESGLHSRENQLFYAKKPHCSGREASFISVTMVDCYPALLVLAYGVGLSVAMFIMEWLSFKRNQVNSAKEKTAVDDELNYSEVIRFVPVNTPSSQSTSSIL